MENHKIDSRKLILERKDSLLLIPLFSLKVKSKVLRHLFGTYISYFSTAVLKQTPGHFQKQGFVWTCGSRLIRVHQGMEQQA